MIWVVFGGAAALAATAALTSWALRMNARVDAFLEAVRRGECTCTRHHLCPVCLAKLRGPQPEPTKEAA